MAFGRNDTAEYLAMNPNGRVPTLVDGDYVLWESNSIMRYLNLAYGGGSPIFPASPQARAAGDRRLARALSPLQPARPPGFLGVGRAPVGKSGIAAGPK